MDIQKKTAHALEQEREDVLKHDRTGLISSLTLIRNVWCSLTKPASPRRWPVCAGVPCAGNVAAPVCRTVTGKPRLGGIEEPLIDVLGE